MANGTRKPMRQGQQNRRGRGRGRKVQNPLSRNYESNGPDVKIRGTAAHIAEKYMTLARDALSGGDTVAGESYLQHAEHYNRIIMAGQTQQPEGVNGSGGGRGRRDETAEETNEKQAEEAPANASAGQPNNEEGVLRTLSRAAKGNGSGVAVDENADAGDDAESKDSTEKGDASKAPDKATT